MPEWIYKMLRGAYLTLKYGGVRLLFNEVMGRYTGRPYEYRGVVIDSQAKFRTLRAFLSKSLDVRGEGDYVVVKTQFGELAVRAEDFDLLRTTGWEDFFELYGVVKDGVVDTGAGDVVIDIGAYIGDTALFFAQKGAKRIYAFEPVERYFKYLLLNVERNGIADKVVALNYGVWWREAEIGVTERGGRTGDTPGVDVVLKTKRLDDVLRWVAEREGRIDWVKMDCEGCEYVLLTTPCDVLRLSPHYIIEIHGSPITIIDKMEKCGYKSQSGKKLAPLGVMYYFGLGGESP